MAVAALAAAAVIVPPLLSDDEGAAEDEAAQTFLEPGQIFLQPAADIGPDPFGQDFAKADPPLDLAPPASDTETEIPTTGSQQVSTNSGAQPRLFGGTGDDTACDRDLFASFLTSNQPLATEWIGAQNADPDFRWSGGALTLDTLGAYIETLTPVIITQPTQLINHGLRNGRAYSIPAVFQPGTAVLVDEFGQPRARCRCGNPLITAQPLSQQPTYVGKPWPGFQPGNVTVVFGSEDPLTEIRLTNLSGGGDLVIQVGSTTPPQPADGSSTTPPSAPATQSPATQAPATQPPATQPPTAAPTADQPQPGNVFAGPDQGLTFRVEVPAGTEISTRMSESTGGTQLDLGGLRLQDLGAAPNADEATYLDSVRADPDSQAFINDPNCQIDREPFAFADWVGQRDIYSCPGLPDAPGLPSSIYALNSPAGFQLGVNNFTGSPDSAVQGFLEQVLLSFSEL